MIKQIAEFSGNHWLYFEGQQDLSLEKLQLLKKGHDFTWSLRKVSFYENQYDLEFNLPNGSQKKVSFPMESDSEDSSTAPPEMEIQLKPRPIRWQTLSGNVEIVRPNIKDTESGGRAVREPFALLTSKGVTYLLITHLTTEAKIRAINQLLDEGRYFDEII